jgi:hypothetical protein
MNPVKAKQILLATVLAVGSVATASATTVVFDVNGIPCAGGMAGLCTAVGGTTQIDFDSAVGSTTSPFVSGAASYSFAAGDSPFVINSASGQFAAPPNDSTGYLTVGSPGRPSEVTIDFAFGINYFGLYMGSPDAYNYISFYEANNNTPVATFSGNDLVPGAQGDQSIGKYFNFHTVGGTVNRIVLTSTSAAFETDNHAYNDATVPTPEPGTFMLMGGSLLGLGTIVRRVRR